MTGFTHRSEPGTRENEGERERKTQVEQVPEDVTDQASLGTRNRREKTSSCEVPVIISL